MTREASQDLRRGFGSLYPSVHLSISELWTAPIWVQILSPLACYSVMVLFSLVGTVEFRPTAIFRKFRNKLRGADFGQGTVKTGRNLSSLVCSCRRVAKLDRYLCRKNIDCRIILFLNKYVSTLGSAQQETMQLIFKSIFSGLAVCNKHLTCISLPATHLQA